MLAVSVPRPTPRAGRLRRLAEELEDEGVGFVAEGPDDALVDELDHALRPAVHERRVPSYGAIVEPEVDPERWQDTTDLDLTRLPTTDFGDAQIRWFADGLSSWAVRGEKGLDELAVFDRSAGSERDLVVLARAAQARLVQRHPSGVVRVVGRFGVVRRLAGGWLHEPPLESWIDQIPGCIDEGNRTTLAKVLAFAVHDLAAGHIGATLVVHPDGGLLAAHEERLPLPPALRIDRASDLAPLRHALGQNDGAAVFDMDGVVRAMGVRLVPSGAAESAVSALGGTRHTSALRYSHDDPDAVVIVVSDDGPVTVVRAGEIVARSPVA